MAAEEVRTPRRTCLSEGWAQIGRGLGRLLLAQAGRGAAADIDAVAGFIYSILTSVWPYRQRVIKKNGALALGLQGAELQKFTKGFYRHFSNAVAEILAGFGMTAQQIRARIHWEAEDFDWEIAKSPVVIVLTAHQGNWEWQIVGCSIRFPVHLLGVYQKLQQGFFNEAMQEYRSKAGAIPTAQMQILRKLSRLPAQPSAVLAMVADQAPGVGGAIVLPFLDTETGFFSGPQLLAARLKAPTFFLSMLPGKLPHTYASEMIRLTPGREAEEYARLLSEHIRISPYTYLWSHNRFKHRYGNQSESPKR